jgi:nicotinate-nucleotide adenylyltransferase
LGVESGGYLKRIGLFGGTFNPVHLGHLRAAVEVREGFGLDEIFLIPAALPPHKMPGEVVAAADRLQMLKRALEDTAGISISDVELKRFGPSFTIDTVQHFRCFFPEDTGIYLIMGLDAFLEINTWKNHEALIEQIPFIVINRPIAGVQNSTGWKVMEDYLKAKISTEYVFSQSQSCFQRGEVPPIYVYEITGLDISSTTIRKLIRKGRSIDYLTPQKVAEFIKSEGLYL